jgi:hypothetical protein
MLQYFPFVIAFSLWKEEGAIEPVIIIGASLTLRKISGGKNYKKTYIMGEPCIRRFFYNSIRYI